MSWLEDLIDEIDDEREKKIRVHGGIGFCDALALIFIVLKLTGVINWSWWWVLAPIWIPIALILGFIILLLIVCGIAALFN